MPKVPKIILTLIEEGPDILVILLITVVANFILRRIFSGTKKFLIQRMEKRGDAISLDTEKNVKTIEAVLGRALSLLIWTSAILAILKRVKIDVSGILTGAGIVGVAVGFGSQTLIKDVIAGLFLLLENQIRVNDSALINGVAGSVEEVNLRTTVIRAENGGLHIFPNGSITTLANLSRGFAHYLFDFVITPDSNIDTAFATMTAVIDEMRLEPPYKDVILAPLEIYGVDRVMEQGINIRGRIKTLPHKQWGVGREANKRFLARFAVAGISLSSRLVNIKVDGHETTTGSLNRDDIKNLIREVLEESRQPYQS